MSARHPKTKLVFIQEFAPDPERMIRAISLLSVPIARLRPALKPCLPAPSYKSNRACKHALSLRNQTAPSKSSPERFTPEGLSIGTEPDKIH